MRAMRVPISCFTNKKNSRVEMARLFLFAKNAHYTYKVLTLYV